MKKLAQYVLILSSCFILFGCPGPEKPSTEISEIPAPKNLQAKFITEYPHDTSAFTEGLQYINGKLYEGTGDWQNSALKLVDLKTGKNLQKQIMGTPEGPNGIFGEGITVLKDKLYQLTWMNHIAYVYDIKDLTKPIKQFPWPYQGWGMTTDGTQLMISDGQDAGFIYFVNPETFTVTKTIQVKTNTGTVKNVNELEFVDGFIYANIWMTDYILKIDTATGNAVGILNVKTLIPQFYGSYPIEEGNNVLNGIAFDADKKQLLITGKRWPKLFAISIPE